MVGVTGFLLTAVLVAQTVLAMLENLIADQPLLDTAVRVASSAIPMGLGTLMLAMMYRFGPDEKPAWADIWSGTLLAVVLLLITAGLYGVYLPHFADSSATGIASAAILLIALVYLVAQIVLFGAEFIRARGVAPTPAT